MSGNTQISLSDFNNCEKKEKKECAITEQCCAFNEITFNFDYDSNVSVKPFNFFNSSILFNEINTILLDFIFTKTGFNFYTNLPPPSGYQLLKIVQVFRL